MRKFIIIPSKDDDMSGGSVLSVPSYINKALSLGKEKYGDNFILAEYTIGRLNGWYDTFNRYDHTGKLIFNKKGVVK